MPEKYTGIPDGITADDVCQAVQDLDAGALEHRFEPSTSYDVVVRERRYPPRAVIGVAARRLAGRVLDPNEFEGGVNSKCFKVLTELGFEIIEKEAGDEPSPVTEGGQAAAIIVALLPEQDVRSVLLGGMAEAVHQAHAVNPASWTLTLPKPGGILNLNVGDIFVLRIKKEYARVAVTGQLVAEHQEELTGWLHPQTPDEEFKSVDGVTWVGAPHEQVVAAWSWLEPGYLKAVSYAASRDSRVTYRAAHSDAACAYVGHVAGRPVPRPAWQSSAVLRPPRLWVCRGGRQGEAHQQFLNDSVIGLSWNELGDLSDIGDFEDLKTRMRERYPGQPDGYYRTCAGEVWRVLREMQSGHAVLYPVRDGDKVWVGVIDGLYRYSPGRPHAITRPVRWLAAVRRDDLPTEIHGALHATLGCFSVNEAGTEWEPLFERLEVLAGAARRFLELADQPEGLGDAIRTHRADHERRQRRWGELLEADEVSPDDLLAALKDTDWYLGTKKTYATEAVATPESTRALHHALKRVASAPPDSPASLRKAAEDTPAGFSYGFLSEFLAYCRPTEHWEWNGPVREMVSWLAPEILTSLPWGEKGTVHEYFAVGPFVEQARSALERAGLEGATFLDADQMLWEMARDPKNFPMLPPRVDEKALDGLIEDLKVYHPGFTTFAEAGSSWWEEERGYKLALVDRFRALLPATELTPSEAPEWAEKIRAQLLELLSRRYEPGGNAQNLVGWRMFTFLRPMEHEPELAGRFARALSQLLLGDGPSDERLERFNSEFTSVLGPLVEGSTASMTRSIPTLLLMLADQKHDILVRTEEFKNVAGSLTGDQILDEGPMTAAQYRRVKSFARSLFRALARRGLQPLDMISVQGFIHVVAARNTWIFQAAPGVWDLAGFLAKGYRETAWQLPQHHKKVQEGDEVYLWLAGDDRGVVAHGALDSAAVAPEAIPKSMREREAPFYGDAVGALPKDTQYAFVTIEEAFPDSRLLASQLAEDPELKGLRILKNAQGTVFSVTNTQAVALRKKLREHLGGGNDPMPPTFDELTGALRSAGLFFTDELVANFLLALQTKRFVILTGISGTGKTKLAMAVAEQFPAVRKARSGTEATDAAARITVKPYMRKYSRFVIPAAVAKLAPWDLTEGSRSMGRFLVDYDGTRVEQSFYRAPHRNVTIALFSGEVREWFLETFPEEAQFDIDIEVGDNQETVLSIRPVQTEERTETVANREVVAVRPDWTDHRGLLGYFNPLTGSYVRTPFLGLLMEAEREIQRADKENRQPAPFFVVLDEMNLARVEHYFSDLLSCMESGDPIHLHDDDEVASGEAEDDEPVPKKLGIPPNLFVIGTVNVDETTYMFSPKVLDRAFTIELNQVDLEGYAASAAGGAGHVTPLELPRFTGLAGSWRKPEPADWQRFGEIGGEWRERLIALNTILAEEGRHFGYRVANEIGRFVTLAHTQTDGSTDAVRAAFDLAVLKKVLPKLHGTQQELHGVIRKLFGFAVGPGGGGPVDPDELEPTGQGFRKKAGEAAESKVETQAEESEANAEDRPSEPVLPRTAHKLWRMARRLRQRGFVSYIE